MVASSWLIRTNQEGVPIDSIRLSSRLRRGIPTDLDSQLEKNKDAGAEMLLVSALMALGHHDEKTYMVHVDFRPEGPGEAATAYASVVDWSNHRQCVDAAIPLAPNTRPAFQVKADTIVVAQNYMQSGDSTAVGKVRFFVVGDCR